MSQPPQDTIAAASVVICREGPAELCEILMVERTLELVFAGGLSVFPGGRVDPSDIELATQIGAVQIEEAAARIAAIRETIEEVGISIGLAPDPSVKQLKLIREGLHQGRSLGVLLEEQQLDLDLAALVPWARWVPAHTHNRRFDTRFYLALAKGNTDHACVNSEESTRMMWGEPDALLDSADAGRLGLMYPTRRNLERLARLSSFAAAKEHALRTPVSTITPWFETRGGAVHLCIPDDAGYPVTSQEFSVRDGG